MKEELIVVYERPDTYHGHSKINHYHIPTKIECFFVDYSDERNMHIVYADGKELVDKYMFKTYNYKNDCTYVYSYENKNEAHNALKNVMSYESGWKRSIKKA